MIMDLQRFLAAERPYWNELEAMISNMEQEVERVLDLRSAKRFHYLYQRAQADLAKLSSFPAEPRVRRDLESLVARAYAEIHESRDKRTRLAPLVWITRTFPQTFRRHAWAFALSLAVTLAGSSFGAFVLYIEPGVKSTILAPFPHLHGDPSERVKHEEKEGGERLAGHMGGFSASLWTNNTRVSIMALALGMTYGIGTILLLFHNGVILGVVGLDYVLAGEGKFLAGWLLPHGSVEIPCILIAGQAGLVLARALIGWGASESVKTRLRQIGPDLVTLIAGVAILLVWAGFVEAFFSQYHEPVLPYSVKIFFGLCELFMLFLYLGFTGRGKGESLAEEKTRS